MENDAKTFAMVMACCAPNGTHPHAGVHDPALLL